MRIVDRKTYIDKKVVKAHKKDFRERLYFLIKALKKEKMQKGLTISQMKALIKEYEIEYKEKQKKVYFTAEEKAIILTLGGKALLKKITKTEAEELVKIKKEKKDI